jgi:hypothetical protein
MTFPNGWAPEYGWTEGWLGLADFRNGNLHLLGGLKLLFVLFQLARSYIHVAAKVGHADGTVFFCIIRPIGLLL